MSTTNPIIRIISYLKPYWKPAALSVVMLSLSVLAELQIPKLLQTIIDTGIAGKDLYLIGTTALLIVVLAFMEAGLAIGNTFLSVRAAQGFAADVRSAVFRSVQGFSFGNLDKFQTGQLIIRLTSDINIVQMMVMMGLRMFIRAPLMIVGSVLLMYSINSELAGITLLIMPLTLVLSGLFVWKGQPMFTQVQTKLDRLNSVLQENLSGVRVVKAFVRQKHESERFGAANEALMKQAMKVNRFMMFLMPALFVLINLGVLSVLYFGGLQVIQGKFTVGEILAFSNYLLSSMFPLIFLSIMASQFSAATASGNRIYEVLDSAPMVQNRPDAKPLGDITGRVAFEDVCFSYGQDCSEPVLDHVSFTTEPGQIVALLGATGSGKSTLINLIPRFYDVNSGRITVDGIDVRSVTIESLRTHIGIALQEPVLFSGTIRDNIRYGKPDATDEEVIEAAKAAQAHDFITSFPKGYDTEVGQRGVGLSGGQKQRVSIARAILIKPKILILDDSTSSVDVETEALIQEALETVMKERTSFIIAQRISSVLKADKILVLDRGRIAAEGNHKDLMTTSPIYREIYDSQLGGGIRL
ncbi:MAG: ABC transporter ATP-binding protein [Candidatus Bathyarchaeota archaeon]|nr:ABC transporter ATP-binding protein [Candidatus Bathyarchaeota archaeon]